MPKRVFQPAANCPYRLLVGVGGIGTGILFALESDHTLGRNESRPGRLLDVRDYCKLHIISHYVAVLLGADVCGRRFRVTPIGKVGADEPGRRMIDEMSRVGIDTRFVEQIPDRPTLFSACFQYPDGTGGNITASNAAASALTAADVDRIEPILADSAGQFIALAVPEVPLEAQNRLLELATKHKGFRAAAFSSAEIGQAHKDGFFCRVDLVGMNEDEASALTGKPFDPSTPGKLLEAVQATLCRQNPNIQIIISAGAGGAYGYAGGVWDHCPPLEVQPKSTAGAGDALLGGVLVGLVAGLPLVCDGPDRKRITDLPLRSALDLAVLLAGATCTSQHTINPQVDPDMLLELADRLGVTISGDITKRLGP